MDIGVHLKELGSIEIENLRDAVLSLDASVWTSNTYRQTEYRQHRFTKSIVLLFTDNEGFPNINVTRENGWDLLSEFTSPIMDRILAEHYPEGGTVIRAMVANLPAGGVITSHIDGHPAFHVGHRIHVPLTTNARVRFMIEGRPYRFEVGKAYELNNQIDHSVMNKGKEDRLTFIFDYVPPDQNCNPKLISPDVAAQ